MKNAHEPAFPEPYLHHPDLALSAKPGLTKREYFAAMAMQGLVSREGWAERFISEGGDKSLMNMLAFASVKMADELLKELERE